MKQTLQLRLGQHLSMTPQLQQAIRLLQLSTLELKDEIQETLESNPMLEQVEAGSESGEEAESESAVTSQEPVDAATVELGSDAQVNELPDELPVDSAWEDTYDNYVPVSSGSGSGEGFDFDQRILSAESLREHLMWQMQMATLSDRDIEIATAIIDGINDDGYLAQSLDEVASAVNSVMEEDESAIGLDEVAAVLHRVQHFDPLGIGARDLRECLLIQLQVLSDETEWKAQAQLLLERYFDLLGGRDFTQLLRVMKCSQEDLEDIVRLIQTLNPRPGGQVTSKAAEYIVPDVVVKKVSGRWRVELNQETLPRLQINKGYAGLVKRADNSADNVFMKNNLQEARWFLKSLQSRNETLLKVATCIVEQQREFLEFGDEAMKAMVLHDVADAIDMHESTISRVTTQKYMHTPRGIFELKYFFSSHVGTAGGGECSATAIRALIKKMVADENVRKPFSDNKLAQILKEQGINVARRTIAKYRESIGIASSSERKRLI